MFLTLLPTPLYGYVEDKAVNGIKDQNLFIHLFLVYYNLCFRNMGR